VGRFDDGLAPAPPVADQRKGDRPVAAAARRADPPPVKPAPAPPPVKAVGVSPPVAAPRMIAAAAAPAPGFDRRGVVRELKDIVRLLDRSRK
jgi:hypothetical protein